MRAVSSGASTEARAAGRSRDRVTVLMVPALLAVAVVLALPMARLIWLSFTEPQPGVQNYAALLGDGLLLTVLLRTLRMAFLVTAICLLCAYPYAYVMTIVSARKRAVLTAIVLLPFWTSLMARTFAWIVLLQEGGPVANVLAVFGVGNGLVGSVAAVTIGMAQVMLPFMVLPLYSAMSSVDPRLMPAAMSLGARPPVAFLRVYLPLTLPGIAAGVTLVMILSLGFYVTPALLGSPKESMIAQFIAVKVQEVLDFGAGGAMSLLLLVLAMLLLALVSRIARPGAMFGGAGLGRAGER